VVGHVVTEHLGSHGVCAIRHEWIGVGAGGRRECNRCGDRDCDQPWGALFSVVFITVLLLASSSFWLTKSLRLRKSESSLLAPNESCCWPQLSITLYGIAVSVPASRRTARYSCLSRHVLRVVATVTASGQGEYGRLDSLVG
jgi:hypothetical protein